jgi:hypothetical protein
MGESWANDSENITVRKERADGEGRRPDIRENRLGCGEARQPVLACPLRTRIGVSYRLAQCPTGVASRGGPVTCMTRPRSKGSG